MHWTSVTQHQPQAEKKQASAPQDPVVQVMPVLPLQELFAETQVQPAEQQEDKLLEADRLEAQKKKLLNVLTLEQEEEIIERCLIVLTNFRPGSSAFLKLVSLFWILGPTRLRISTNMCASVFM